MKKFLFTIILILGVYVLHAQTVSYTPFYPNRSYQQQQQVQSQIVRVVAYAVNSSETGYIKTQLKVAVINSNIGQQIKVVEQYIYNGYGGGRWEKVYASGMVENCMQMFANNPLEAQFMKKVLIGTTYYYFDI